MEQGPLGLNPSFAPHRYQRRTSERARATEYWPGTTPPTKVGPPTCEFTRLVRPRVATSHGDPATGRPKAAVIVGHTCSPSRSPSGTAGNRGCVPLARLRVAQGVAGDGANSESRHHGAYVKPASASAAAISA